MSDTNCIHIRNCGYEVCDPACPACRGRETARASFAKVMASMGPLFPEGNKIRCFSVRDDLQSAVLASILEERVRQDKLWGEQNHLPHYWTGILGEEYGELCEAINETVFDNSSDRGGYDNMRNEAIHVAAVAIGFLECLERNKENWFGGNDDRLEDQKDSSKV